LPCFLFLFYFLFSFSFYLFRCQIMSAFVFGSREIVRWKMIFQLEIPDVVVGKRVVLWFVICR